MEFGVIPVLPKAKIGTPASLLFQKFLALGGGFADHGAATD
jgi:hypothetical protein